MNIRGAFGHVVTFAYRIGSKFLADFSGAPMFADPSDMGKTWLPSMLLIFGLNWYLFDSCRPALRVKSETLEEILFQIMIVTTAGYASAWLLLLLKGAKSDSLMCNFITQSTGKEMYAEAWISVDDHRKMAMIVEINPRQFRDIVNNIKDWIGDNWEQWREEETFNIEVRRCVHTRVALAGGVTQILSNATHPRLIPQNKPNLSPPHNRS